MTSETKGSLPLALLLAAAFALRAAGAGFGLPALFHQDEPAMVNHALAMGVNRLHPHYFVIPGFVMYALFFLYGAVFALGTLAGKFHSAVDFARWFLADPSLLYAAGRLFIGAAFGTATVWITYRLGRAVHSERAGLWAGTFLAAAPLHVQTSRFIYADAPLTFFTVLFLYLAVRAVEHEWQAGRSYLCGAVLGLAMAAKYNAFIFAAGPLVVWIVAAREQLPRKIEFPLKAAFAAGVVFFLFNPYILLDYPAFFETWRLQITAQVYVGPLHHLRYSLAEGLGWPLLIAGIAGAFLLVRERPRAGWVLAISAIAHYILCMYKGQPFARYMVPLLPLACLGGGVVVAHLAANVRTRSVAASTAVLFLAYPLAVSVYDTWLQIRTDTRALCARWIQAELPQGAGVAVTHTFFGPRLRQTREQMAAKLAEARKLGAPQAEILRLEIETERQAPKTFRVLYVARDAGEERPFSFATPIVAPTLEALRAAGMRYVVFQNEDVSGWVSALRNNMTGKPLAVFNPYRDPNKTESADPLGITAGPVMGHEIFSRVRPGPRLEVYEIAEQQA